MPTRRACASFMALSCTLAAAGSSQAQAEPEPVRLAWTRGKGADACASQQRIAAQVIARLGRNPFAVDAASSIEVQVTREDAGFAAEIFVRGRDGALSGSRSLKSEAADCVGLESASVLAIALTIDPDGGVRSVSPPPAVAPPRVHVAPPPAPPRPPPAPAPPGPAEAGRGSSGMSLRGGVGLGILPQAALGLSLSGHLAVAGRVELTAEALWMPEVNAGDARFAFGMSALAFGACASLVRRPVADLGLCASLWGGALHAVVRDLPPTEPGDRAWAGAAATPQLRVALGARVHLELGTHILVPITRWPFTVTGWADPVFRQAPVTALPFAGVGANLL